jgi:hypothetical protein
MRTLLRGRDQIRNPGKKRCPREKGKRGPTLKKTAPGEKDEAAANLAAEMVWRGHTARRDLLDIAV